MLAPSQRHKRPRSPSPPLSPDLASPLDMLLKRRRREELSFSSPNQPSPFNLNHQRNGYFDLPIANNDEHHQQEEQYEYEHPHAESSSSALRRSMKGIERRRTKQWEKQNDPSVLQQQQHKHDQSNSQHLPSIHSPNHYLTPNSRQSQSQPNPMSSSPIRNILPASSPFKVKLDKEYNSPDWNITNEAEEEEEGMDMNEDEMKREWGEEYEKQNWLLHSLHVARMQSQNHQNHFQHNSPNHTLISNHRNNQHHNQPSTHTPLHQTNSNASTQTYITDQTLVSPFPSYRNQPSYPDSSPFNSHHPSIELRSPSFNHGIVGDDEDMEFIESTSGLGHGIDFSSGREDEITRRYEETNRLLGDLEVARRLRWG
ncbi:uncharacterized protein L201_000585 [Kwoniella dendrophila CBS 6074]|uniref:Uncharacterized protein n=1 Tax=Kwoniella dendrophila CBS 6074 TaxID=1295534 RepID=A0AAX4JLR9_9TREE